MSAVTSSTAALEVIHEGKREAARLDNEALAWVLADPRGRRFVGRLLSEHCGLEKSALREGLALLPVNEGKRHVAISLLEEMAKVAPAALGLIHAEEAERRTKKQKTKQAAEAAGESEDV